MKKDRVITLLQSCITYGTARTTNSGMTNICGDKECKNCQNMWSMLKEAAKNYSIDLKSK